jgi:hypothetical protein
MEGYLKALPKGTPHHHPSHWAFSPSDELVDRAWASARGDPGVFLERLRRWGQAVLDRNFGSLIPWGGTVIFHPFRTEGDEQEAGAEGWRRVRARGPLDWRNSVRFSPHFHIAGWGWIPEEEGTNKFFFYDPRDKKKPPEEWRQTWTLVKIRTVQDHEDLEGLVHYLTTHMGVIEGKKAISYWGCLSPLALKVVPVTEKKKTEEEICDICGSPMIVYEDGVPTGCPVVKYHDVRIYQITVPALVGAGAKPPPPWILTDEEYDRRLQAGDSLIERI